MNTTHMQQYVKTALDKAKLALDWHYQNCALKPNVRLKEEYDIYIDGMNAINEALERLPSPSKAEQEGGDRSGILTLDKEETDVYKDGQFQFSFGFSKTIPEEKQRQLAQQYLDAIYGISSTTPPVKEAADPETAAKEASALLLSAMKSAGLDNHIRIIANHEGIDYQLSFERVKEAGQPVEDNVDQWNFAKYSMNDLIGSYHWFNTLMSQVARIGLYMERHDKVDVKLLEDWGHQLNNIAKDMVSWFQSRQQPAPSGLRLTETQIRELAEKWFNDQLGLCVDATTRIDAGHHKEGYIGAFVHGYNCSPAPVQVDPALINAYMEYVKLLCDEIDGLVPLAHTHGWRSERHEKGIELRDKIKSLQNKP